MPPVGQSLLDQLRRKRAEIAREISEQNAVIKACIDQREEAGRRGFDEAEKQFHDEAQAKLRGEHGLHQELKDIDERIDYVKAEEVRAGKGNAMVEKVLAAGAGTGSGQAAYDGSWAATALQRIRATSGSEKRAVIGGAGIDVPSLLPIGVQAIPRPQRISDLLVNRVNTSSYSYECYIASVRQNNAAPTPDLAQKPVSVNTIVPLIDHVRAHAHLSEPVPLRVWEDDEAIRSWLSTEMAEGVLDSIERDAIVSNGLNERQVGVLGLEGLSTPSDRTHVPFTSDLPTTLRSAVTALQQIGVAPTGWVMNPADAQAVDLLRWQTGGGFLSGGFQSDNRGGLSGSSNNIFGPDDIPRVVSPTCPAGTAILAKWSDMGIWVYKGTVLEVNWWGDDFARNSVTLRAEAFVGVNVLRPKSFAIVRLTP